jgi:regulatory protein
MPEQTVRKITDPHKALIKAQKYCAYQERSQQEVRDKLYSYGLWKRDVENIIAELISAGFLKEERFAIAFAGGKFRMKGWGKVKIKQALKFKSVPEKIINIALSEIDRRDYEKTLKKIILERSKAVKETNPLKKNYKIAQYAISRGFEPELVWGFLRQED